MCTRDGTVGHRRKNLSLQPVDREEDAHLFTYRDVNRTHVSVVLAQSVDELVDSDSPQNVVKFRLGCDFDSGDDLISAYLSVTVYIEDVNDNVPKFQDTPYHVAVDELTPAGLTIFKSIRAFDRDKPNTPNSDVQYSIIAGDADGHFALESSHKPALVLKKPLDYDTGDKEFLLVVTASDRGSPPRSTNATVHITVLDNDDLPPKFTSDLYRTQIPEFYPLLGKIIHKELLFPTSIKAFDQDLGVNATLKYELVSGNERKLFFLNPQNGTLYLEKEIDLDAETGLSGNTFVLQVQASQLDNPLKTAQARVEIEVLDLNDNLPEFEVDFYNISIVENLPNGFSVLQVMATDKDQGDNGEFTYQLNDPEGAFIIDPRTGWLTVRNQTVLDREQHSSLKMKVFAKEKNPNIVGTFLDKQRLAKYRRTPTTPKVPTLKEKTTYIFPDKLGTKNENIEYIDNQLMSYVNVEVTLLDANDNNPVFYTKVKAIDPDLGRNGMVLYDLQRTSNLTITSPFQVDAKTGTINVAESPIVEGRHALFIEASDQPANPSERRYSLAVVTIDVTRASKGSKPDKPGFIGAPYEFWVGSNVGIGTSIGQIRINDVMEKNDVSYDLLHSYEDGVPFAVEERSGVITVVDELTKYRRPMYDFEAVAMQENANLSISTNATVHVVDVTDERGVLLKGAHSPLVFSVQENVAGATIGQIFQVNTSALPVNSSGNIRFIIANQQDVTDDIAIGQDGTIYAQKPLDREKRSTYRMTIIAEFTKGMISGAGIYQVTVNVEDENDNPPIFELPMYEGFITENSARDTEVKMTNKIIAKDADVGLNALFTYTIFGDGREMFHVHENTGIVTFIGKKLDREEKSSYVLRIVARDRGGLSSEAKLTINILDENDNVPKFNQIIIPGRIYAQHIGSKPDKPGFIGAPYEFWVGSNVGIGTSIGQIRINDVMEKNDVSYDLLHSYEDGVPFAVEERSGVITVVDELTKYRRPMYDFEAVAMQENANLSISTNATVHVVDVTDERGVLLKGAHSPLVFSVQENVAGATIGQIFQVNTSALPVNSSGNIRFIIANQQDVTDDIAIGQDGTIYAQKPLDREKRSTYRMTIIAEFTKGMISGAGIYQVTVNVEDENDNPPIFELPMYEGFITENSARDTEVKMTNKIIAKDADVGLNALFTYTIFGDGREMFHVHENTGIVTFIGKKLDREEKSSYVLRIVARDRGGLSSEAKLTINILDENDNVPKFNQIIIPFGENIDLLESDTKSSVKIYSETKSNSTTGLVNVETKPKNKFAFNVASAGPLFLIPENVAIGSILLKLNAIDMDSGVNGQVRYEFISEVFSPPSVMPSNSMQLKRYFVINERQGHIIVARTLPPEAEFTLNISALDGGQLSDHISIRFFIKDVNDHFPMFKKTLYSFNVEEAQYTRRVLGKVDATDADFGQNANLTYFIQPTDNYLPFEISPSSGVFSVNGELDREKEDKYILTVVARDNGYDKKLSSSVSVEVQVLDVNDNAPNFYAYDELLEWKHPEADEISNHNFESVKKLPIYKASVDENAPIGTVVAKVFANDSDFIGNGNGLILYSLPQKKNQINLFAIDSKEGIITTTARLDYESQTVHNVTIVASDLGSPSLSSTAILVLTVTDVPDDVEVSDKPVFISRYYELEIEENVHTPVELITLNLTEHFENFKMKYFILNENDIDVKKTFVIDPKNGTLYLVKSPDREKQDIYEIIIRGERQKISRQLPHMIYPVADDLMEGLTKFDVKVIVRVKDVNDNAPRFTNFGRPLVTAIPTTAPFGLQVIQLVATDADVGINADIRYQIINEQAPRFAIDPVTGWVRVVAALTLDAGRVFGFDVKATDKRGADDGKSAIANVFVYVLDENKQLVVTVGAKPMQVEKELDNITNALTGLTGLDIRVRRLEANMKASADGLATDMYIYGVDPLSNAVIDMEVLQKSLMKRETDLRHDLAGFRVLGVGDNTMVQARSGKLLSTMEISVVALGCIVFIGACTTAICILCVRRSRRRHHKPYSQQHLNAFSTEHLTKFGGLFPSGGNQCQELNQSYSEGDSYIDVINHSSKKICPHGNTVEEFGKAHQKCVKNQFGDDMFDQKHERMCIKFNQRPLQKRKGQDTSITSVNSSGQDSGIAEAASKCPCGQSSLHTSEESSGCSYEDSLKSTNNQEGRSKSFRGDHETRFTRRASFGHQPLDSRPMNYRRQSFSENMQRHFPPFEGVGSGGRITRQISTPNVSNIPHSYFLNGNKRVESRRKEVVNEPMVDYDHSEGEDVFDTSHRMERRTSGRNYKRGKFMELGGQAAVFVTSPAAAEIMRRQGSEKLMFARPL
ncbi:unnamed protein product [Arctia plantaginis]|uniref:Cadherin domain-containing protein n=1 Tax=Arctia plantaginis TaxID=874455 RepID=A0A8S0Z4R7_ARCPL|nr:unnamed protein product [Arctia plantaginis]